ncbi:MAG: hypothetical protein HY247_07155 [archaeon]|nr:MAG: hypothetical protein HY247_07155 [archaeon]
MKLIQERTALKLLVERNGVLLSVTTQRRAYFFFLSAAFVGVKVAPTTDPDLGIVELSDYDILLILRNWKRLSRVKVRREATRGKYRAQVADD